jgi:FtsP/CotA-like multicopper oxidase with cupredoxin domain
MKEVEVGESESESESTDTTGGSSSSVIESSSYLLMGRPIHVMQNEILSLEINNKLPSTGLSIHFHGFEMANKVEYDGVVGT